jgi:non-heme chloroperoxidase
MEAGFKGAYDCVKAFSESDFTTDLKRVDVPLLIIHGDDDQIVPIGISAMRTAKMVSNATLKVYHGGPHGVMATHRDQLHKDLLEFAKAHVEQRVSAPADAMSRPREREVRPSA